MHENMRSQHVNEAPSATSSRRSHKKSRKGCRNCKLRSVKCDESKPDCKRCISYGVSCNYNPKAADLQSSFGETAVIKEKSKCPGLADQSLVDPLRAKIPPSQLYVPAVIHDRYSSLQMDAQSLERLRRFHLRTVLTMGSPEAASTFQSYAIEMSCSAPYVMHLVQALTSMHDRYLSDLPGKCQTVAEAYHMSRAASLFNQRLSAPLNPSDRDAVWAASCLIGWIAFSSIEATQAFEAWPLAPPKPSDLNWLRMNDGKAALWCVAEPSRPDSIFNVLAVDFAKGLDPLDARDVDIPAAFTRLYDLDNPASDAGPYAVAVRALMSLMGYKCDRSSIVPFLLFQGNFQSELRELLMRKDARAMLLLAYWYAMICRAVWWVERRATVECRAICVYLERYHSDDADIMELLDYPKMRCGVLMEGGS